MLFDDIKGREDVESVIDAALDILVIDCLVCSSLSQSKQQEGQGYVHTQMNEDRIYACLIKAHTYLTELLVGRQDLICDPGAVCFLSFANLVVDSARQVHQLLILLAVVIFHCVQDCWDPLLAVILTLYAPLWMRRLN